MICSRAFCSESRHALRSCSVVLPPIKLTIAPAAARQVSSMLICGMSARVLSVEPHIMATTAAAITTAFDILELGIVLAEVPSSTEVEIILIMGGLRRPPHPHSSPQHELSRGGLQCRDDTLNVETTSEGECLPGPSWRAVEILGWWRRRQKSALRVEIELTANLLTRAAR